MGDISEALTDSLTQQPTQASRISSTNPFIEFRKEEIEQSIPDRFEKIVHKHPDRTAVKTMRHILTYRELNAMANRLARAVLAQQGSKAEPVGLLLENGGPLMAATLGVLKAGKFILLLDPSSPKARIAATLEDSHAKLVVTDRQNASLARDAVSDHCPLMEFESIDANIPTDNLRRLVPAKALAFLIHTSGSTGQPKGVMQTHRSRLHRVMGLTNTYQICSQDRSSLLRSGTSNAVGNSLLSLLNGGVLLPFDVRKEGVARLASWLLQEKISICSISAPLFRTLCETLTGNEKFPDMRVLRVATDRVYKTDMDLYKKYFSPNCIFGSSMASTEAGLLTTYRADHKTEIIGKEVPVGYAVEGKEILLLDDTGKEVGFNQVGEIAVRSRYLFPGYWRRPDLTKAKFIRDPKDRAKRIYLTGDLGLRLADGCLVYKGRKDLRVKVRGYGVELPEVEKTLLEHSAIKNAIVIARRNELGEARLVAYFTSSIQPGPRVSELQSFLKQKLPSYMIPSAFVFLDVLPLTPNGKVDRQALPEAKQVRPELDSTFVAPRNALERQLTQIWEKILGTKPIGVKDNFFDLGGHSLLAADLLTQIAKVSGKDLPLAILFQAPTVEQLACFLSHKGRSVPRSLLVPLQSRGSKLPFFCHGASLELALHVGANQPFYGLQPHGQDGREAPVTIEEMAADYIKEIRTVQPDGPYFLGGFSFGGVVAFEMAQQLLKQGQQVALLALLDPSPPISANLWPSAPLWRDWLCEHLRNLKRLGYPEKLLYTLERVKWRTDRIKIKTKRAVCSFCLAIGRPIPSRLRMFYFFQVSGQAKRKYVPQLYPGRVLLLRAKERPYDSRLNWSKLIEGELEIHELPGNHLDVIHGPLTAVWSEKLRECLQRTQTMVSHKPT